MKCVKCGAELKEGCIYCSVCGKEAQIVPDYSILEDDYLRALLKEEEEASASRQQQNMPKQEKHSVESKKKKLDSRVPIFVVCGILVIAIILGIVIKLVIDYNNANSYDYQIEAARQEYIDKNYESALHYYKTALSLKPEDVAVRLAMADIYVEQADYDSALVLLIEVIALDSKSQKAYEQLIHIYEKNEDYTRIAELASSVKDDDVLKLFDGYLVAPPTFSHEEGEYDEYLNIELSSSEDFEIYYTLDGTDPDKENGIKYDVDEKEQIMLDEAGEYLVRAVCFNKKGIPSEVVEASYHIEVEAPEYAVVSPDGGRITSETMVTIEAADNCTIYYTWDGTDPTEASLKYQEPLEIPTGNNILSVLVVDDRTGLDSGIYRTNFIYYP